MKLFRNGNYIHFVNDNDLKIGNLSLYNVDNINVIKDISLLKNYQKEMIDYINNYYYPSLIIFPLISELDKSDENYNNFLDMLFSLKNNKFYSLGLYLNFNDTKYEVLINFPYSIIQCESLLNNYFKEEVKFFISETTHSSSKHLTGEDIVMLHEKNQKNNLQSKEENICDRHWDGA